MNFYPMWQQCKADSSMLNQNYVAKLDGMLYMLCLFSFPIQFLFTSADVGLLNSLKRRFECFLVQT